MSTSQTYFGKQNMMRSDSSTLVESNDGILGRIQERYLKHIVFVDTYFWRVYYILNLALGILPYERVAVTMLVVGVILEVLYHTSKLSLIVYSKVLFCVNFFTFLTFQIIFLASCYFVRTSWTDFNVFICDVLVKLLRYIFLIEVFHIRSHLFPLIVYNAFVALLGWALMFWNYDSVPAALEIGLVRRLIVEGMLFSLLVHDMVVFISYSDSLTKKLGKTKARIKEKKVTELSFLKRFSHVIHTNLSGLTGENSENASFCSRNIRRLANDLLVFAQTKMDDGFAVSEESFRPIDVIKSSIEVEGFILLRNKRHERVVVQIDKGSFPKCVKGDSVRVEQVIGGILSNSIKYSSSDIVLRFYYQDESLCFSCSDSGKGFSEEQLRQINGTIGTKFLSREGIGISICKSIVRKLGGKIKWENREEGGAIVSVKVPLPIGKAVDVGKVDYGEEITVLIVDDSMLCRKVLSIISSKLWENGKFHVAKHGLEAWEMITTGGIKPDLIICDLDMPIMRGEEFSSRFASEVPLGDLPTYCVAMSASLPVNIKEFCKKYSFDKAYSKPLGKMALIECHVEVMSRREQYLNDKRSKQMMKTPVESNASGNPASVSFSKSIKEPVPKNQSRKNVFLWVTKKKRFANIIRCIIFVAVFILLYQYSSSLPFKFVASIFFVKYVWVLAFGPSVASHILGFLASFTSSIFWLPFLRYFLILYPLADLDISSDAIGKDRYVYCVLVWVGFMVSLLINGKLDGYWVVQMIVWLWAFSEGVFSIVRTFHRFSQRHNFLMKTIKELSLEVKSQKEFLSKCALRLSHPVILLQEQSGKGRIVQACIGEFSRIIGNFKAYSIDGNGSKMNGTWFVSHESINNCITRIVNTYEVLHPEKFVSLILNSSDFSMPMSPQWHETLLRNSISNAFQHSPTDDILEITTNFKNGKLTIEIINTSVHPVSDINEWFIPFNITHAFVFWYFKYFFRTSGNPRMHIGNHCSKVICKMLNLEFDIRIKEETSKRETDKEDGVVRIVQSIEYNPHLVVKTS